MYQLQSTASEILEEYYSNYEDSIGIDTETISQLIIKAKEKFIEDGLLHKEC